MLSTKIRKIVSIITIAMMLMITVSNVCLADNKVDTASLAKGITGETSDASNSLETMGGTILGFIQTAGVIIAVIILAVIGVKYIMGSAEEKAEYKKTMIPYLVGAVLIAAAPFIAGAVFSFAGSIAGTTA